MVCGIASAERRGRRGGQRSRCGVVHPQARKAGHDDIWRSAGPDPSSVTPPPPAARDGRGVDGLRLPSRTAARRGLPDPPPHPHEPAHPPPDRPPPPRPPPPPAP